MVRHSLVSTTMQTAILSVCRKTFAWMTNRTQNFRTSTQRITMSKWKRDNRWTTMLRSFKNTMRLLRNSMTNNCAIFWMTTSTSNMKPTGKTTASSTTMLTTTLSKATTWTVQIKVLHSPRTKDNHALFSWMWKGIISRGGSFFCFLQKAQPKTRPK